MVKGAIVREIIARITGPLPPIYGIRTLKALSEMPGVKTRFICPKGILSERRVQRN